METIISYRKRVKLSEFQTLSDRITPLIQQGNLKGAFSVFDEMKIGVNTLNPKARNFTWWLIEAICDECEEKNHIAKVHYLNFFKQFINNGLEINHKDRYNITALNWAVFFHQPEVCEILLEKGASPDIPDDSGRTPLDYAIELFYEEKYGYFPQTDTSSEIIMSDIMKLLLKYGADPYRPYPSPNTISPLKRDWLFMENFDEPFTSPIDRLRREAPLLGYETNPEDEPRLKIVLTGVVE